MLLLCCNVNSTFFQTQHDDKQARTIAVQTDPVVCSCHHSHPTVERKSVSVATEDMASNAIVSNDHGYAIKESLLSPSHQQSTYATASSTIVPIQHPSSSDDSSKSSDEQASNMSDEDYIPQSSSSSSDGTDSEQESTSRDESAESVSGMRMFESQPFSTESCSESRRCYHHHQCLNRDGRWGTQTDVRVTTFLNGVLFRVAPMLSSPSMPESWRSLFIVHKRRLQSTFLSPVQESSPAMLGLRCYQATLV